MPGGVLREIAYKTQFGGQGQEAYPKIFACVCKDFYLRNQKIRGQLLEAD